MTLELEAWHVISVCISICTGFFALIKIMFAQFTKALEKKFDTLEEDAKGWAHVEKDLLKLKADLPLHYVRREDYVRNQTVIESKLDALAVSLQNWQLKEVKKQ